MIIIINYVGLSYFQLSSVYEEYNKACYIASKGLEIYLLVEILKSHAVTVMILSDSDQSSSQVRYGARDYPDPVQLVNNPVLYLKF